jgi:hypothetical protein
MNKLILLKTDFLRSHQATVASDSWTIINSLFFILSLTTEIGCIQGTIFVLFSVVAKEESFKFFMEYPNFLCIVVGNR